jgi:hypothetical protein
MGKNDRGLGERPFTFRKRWGRRISVSVWLLAAIVIGAQILLNKEQAFNSVLMPWLVLVSWGVYVFEWRPRLTITESGFEMCNGEKTYYIPFAAIEGIQNRYRIFITAEGKSYVSQVGALPGSNVVGSDLPVPTPDRTTTANDRGRSSETQSTQDPITAAWLSARSAPAPHGRHVTTRRNYASLIFAVGPLIWFFTVWLHLKPHGFS